MSTSIDPAPDLKTSPDNVVLKQGQSFTDPGGRTGTVNYDSQTGKKLDPGATTNSNPALIVTSNASRANHAENLDTINKANNSIKEVQSGQTASGIAASLGMTPEKFLELNPGYAAKGDLVGGANKDYKGLTGLIKPGQTYKVGMDGKPVPVDEPKADKAGNTTITDPNDNTTTTTDKEGNKTTTTADGTVLDPSVKKQFDDNINAMTDAANNVKTVMDKAAATLADDPAAQQAAANIKTQYDVLIQQMKDKNKILLGSIGKNSARSGMLQYANEMDMNFKSMEFDKSVQRVSDLVEKENTAIAKSNAAYKNNDIKAFDTATKEYQSALKDKQKAILDLNKAINDTVKQNATDIKEKRMALAAQTTNDIRLSTSLGSVMADAITKSGVTDEAQIDKYVQAMADQNGITNPEILKSALVKAQNTNQSLDLTNTRKQQLIDKGSKPTPGKSKSPKITKFDKPTTTALYGTGLSGGDVDILQQAIYKYGAQSVIDNPKLGDSTKTILENLYGLTRTK